MKKIFYLFTLLFAFSISAVAQDKNITEKAKAESLELSQALNLNEEKSVKLYDIILHKHKSLTQLNLSDAEKKDLRDRTRKEIKALLNQQEMVLLEKNSVIFNRVTKL